LTADESRSGPSDRRMGDGSKAIHSHGDGPANPASRVIRTARRGGG
jgi:hypothetical protein